MSSVVISKKVFIDALDRVRPTVSNNKTVDILQHFCFKGNTVSTSNGHAGTVTALDLNKMEFCVPADRFWKMINSQGDEISLFISGGQLTIRSGTGRMNIPTVQVRGFPDPIPPKTLKLPTCAGLLKAFKKVEFTISTNANKIALMGIGVHKTHAYSSDGTCITRAKFDPAEDFPFDFTIPAAAVKHLMKLGEPSYYFTDPVGNSFGCFYEDTKTVYTCAVLAQQFPYNTVENYIKQCHFLADFTVKLPQGLEDTVTRATLVLSGSAENSVILNNTEGGLGVSAASPDGDFEDVLAWDYKTPFKICVNPQRLLAALERTDIVDFEEVVKGDKSCLPFKDEEGMNHILALMFDK